MTTRTWKSVKSQRLRVDAASRVNARVHQKLDELTLKELRNDLELTQAEVAGAAGMTQSELSRLESRADHRVSILRRYVEALGGEMEITAIVGGKRVKLTDV
jgi:predicted transcriptional regulator